MSPWILSGLYHGVLAALEAIGFEGLLLTDDLSMKALGGPLGERARAAFAAGVDIALHCNGDLSESRAVVEATPELTGRSLERAAGPTARQRSPARASLAGRTLRGRRWATAGPRRSASRRA